MKNLITYEHFLIMESNRRFQEFASNDGKKRFFEALSESRFLSDEEKDLTKFILEDESWLFFFDESLNEESLADKIKAKAEAAMRVIKDKGKKYLSDTQEAILKIGGSIKGLIDKVVGVVKAFLQKAWEYIKSQVESKYDKLKEEITKAASGKFKGKADVAKDEVKNLGSMTKGALKWCTGGAADSMSKGMEQAGSMDESFTLALENGLYMAAAELIMEDESFVNYLKFEDVNEDLNEGGDHGGGPKVPFLSALAHKLAEFEPFKSLHKVEHAAGDAANKGLGAISSFLSKVASAPGPFEFTIVGAVFALITGYAIKAGVKSLIEEIGVSAFGAAVAAAVPGIGVILLAMKYTAKGIWCVGVCEAAISIVAGGDKDEHHDEEDHKKEE